MNPYQVAIREVRSLLKRAHKTRLKEPTAMTLATVSPSGRPAVRTVLLKNVSEDGFVFYTNLKSRKGRHLALRPHCALCFFWEPLGSQIIVEGRVKPVAPKEADAYWKTRPRESQLGAWASLQSQELKNRATLFERLRAMNKKFAGMPVPRPAHWSGFCVVPNRLEIWKRGAARLHHRQVYEKAGLRWKKRLLYP